MTPPPRDRARSGARKAQYSHHGLVSGGGASFAAVAFAMARDGAAPLRHNGQNTSNSGVASATISASSGRPSRQ